MRMNISVPDALAEQVRERNLPISAICQQALREELRHPEDITRTIGEDREQANRPTDQPEEPPVPENEKPNPHWLVSPRDTRETEFAVWAAYLRTHSAASASDLIMTTLKDADQEIVFQAPATALNYVRRAQSVPAGDTIFVPLRTGEHHPGQVRDLQDALNEAIRTAGDIVQGHFVVLPPRARVIGGDAQPDAATGNA